MSRRLLLSALEYVSKRLPRFAIKGQDAMDDATLLATVMIGLAALYASASGSSVDVSVDYAPRDVMPAPQPPAPPPPPPDPTPLPSQPPVVGGAGDQINAGSVAIVNAPDFRPWPITARISRIESVPGDMRVFVDGLDSFPGSHANPAGQYPAGFVDPVQYTVWLFLNVGGAWVGSAFIQGTDGGYHLADGVGDDVFDFHNNWYYAPRWGAMFDHGPIGQGETIGIMVQQGNGRDDGGPYLGMRTQIVAFPASYGTFTF